MLQLKNILQQLSNNDFEQLADSLKKSKADKFLALLQFYKEGKVTDEEIQKKLDINSNAFYVLKSRLFDKVQTFLRLSSEGDLTDTLKKLVTIPALVYNTDRSIASAILTRLEKDLLESDMPHELIWVYSALKKINIHSDKYYEYTQLYNKHVAYTLALNKADDLLTDFIKKLGEYDASRNESLLPIFAMLKKEIRNLSNLYKSHHLQVYQNIIDISIALFLPVSDAIKEDKPVEDLLDDTETILSNYPKDSSFQYLRLTLNFLFYEYYHKYKLLKKEMQYFELINSQLPVFFFQNHTCYCSKFLISKIETYLELGKEETLTVENEKMLDKYKPEKSDIPNYINFMKYMAASAFYENKYAEASKILSALMNDIGFKHFPHSEIELKLFLTLTYSMCNKYELAWNILRSATRKISELNENGSYENAKVFAKILNIQLSSTSQKGQAAKKIIPLRNQFDLLNRGDKRLLEFIKLNDIFIEKLGKPVK